MDIQTNEQEFVDIRCLRIQTKRQKVRRIRKGHERELVRAFLERDRLWDLRAEQDYIVIDPPYQSGWCRTYELHPDTAAGDQAKFFLEILDLVNSVQKSYRKDFKKKARKQGRKIYTPTIQNLESLWEWKWRELSPAHQSAFREAWFVNKRGELNYTFVCKEPWRFVLKVRPNMITRAIAVNPDLESKIGQIDGMIRRQHMQPLINHLLTGSSGRYRDRDYTYSPRSQTKKTVSQYFEVIQEETL